VDGQAYAKDRRKQAQRNGRRARCQRRKEERQLHARRQYRQRQQHHQAGLVAHKVVVLLQLIRRALLRRRQLRFPFHRALERVLALLPRLLRLEALLGHREKHAAGGGSLFRARSAQTC
jgi:hypothetical protein